MLHLFFMIQNNQLPKFCAGDLEYMVIFHCVLCCFHSIKSHADVINYFIELPIYNRYIEKPKIKCLKSINLLSGIPFYDELNVTKTDRVFKGYAMSYKVALVEKEIPINSVRSK